MHRSFSCRYNVPTCPQPPIYWYGGMGWCTLWITFFIKWYVILYVVCMISYHHEVSIISPITFKFVFVFYHKHTFFFFLHFLYPIRNQAQISKPIEKHPILLLFSIMVLSLPKLLQPESTVWILHREASVGGTVSWAHTSHLSTSRSAEE